VSDLGLVPGVVAVNAILVAAGYAVLWASLREVNFRTWWTYSGLALLVGAAVTFCVLGAVSVSGLPLGTGAFLLATASVAATGMAAGLLLPAGWRRRLRPIPAPGRAPERLESAVATAAAVALVAVSVLVVIGGFRSTPTLDDTWTMWLPKGRVLGSTGFDPRFFVTGTRYLPFASPDHPFWWSLAANTVVTSAGNLDLRAVNAEIAILLGAFVAATVRLLWGHVRSAFLLVGLLLLLLAPELIRQAQGGGADVPLAIFLVLFVLTAARWLVAGEGFGLGLSVAFAGAALTMKKDGAPELLAFLLVLTALWLRPARGRVGVLWLAVGGALAFASPWVLWMAAHGVRGEIPIRDFVSPTHLVAQAERVWPAVRTLASHLFSFQQWPLVVPLFLAGAVGVAVRLRVARWLSPAALFLVGYALLVWVIWADPLELSYRLGVASRRMVVPIVVLAGVAIPILAEALIGAPRRAEAPSDRSPG
jgi:hypothetical protein